ncbi:MAG: diguanylate cyclase [Deltaproteobacteria bacterium]|nr:diguanylate cyclase [Deltaproteobacteria bacterium]
MKNILIIDQDPDSRVMLKNDLVGTYKVFEALDANDAISVIQKEKIDLILLDMEREDNKGADICTQLKRALAKKHIPLILLSTYNQKEDIINGLHSGAEDYLNKPFYPSELFARIDAHLRVKNYYSFLEKEDLLMLLTLTEIISVARSPKKILRSIVEKMALVAGVSRCSIISLDDDGDLIVKASSDLPDNRDIKLNLKNYPEIQKALSTLKPVVVQDIKRNPLLEPVRDKIIGLKDNSLFVVPIIKKQSVIGTFFLRTTSPLKGGISGRIFKLCQLVANISGNALENAIIFEAMQSNRELLEDLAFRDSLTRLYNHQQFHVRFEEEFSRAKRYGLPLTCIFTDIDDFKNINDQFGHIVGDVALKQIGKIINQILRKSDIAARTGGDEFAVLLPNTSYTGGKDFADRLSDMIRGVTIKSHESELISVSIGVSTFENDSPQSYEELLDLADKAMYSEKQRKKEKAFQLGLFSTTP